MKEALLKSRDQVGKTEDGVPAFVHAAADMDGMGRCDDRFGHENSLVQGRGGIWSHMNLAGTGKDCFDLDQKSGQGPVKQGIEGDQEIVVQGVEPGRTGKKGHRCICFAVQESPNERVVFRGQGEQNQNKGIEQGGGL